MQMPVFSRLRTNAVTLGALSILGALLAGGGTAALAENIGQPTPWALGLQPGRPRSWPISKGFISASW
jgi:hypothetical protein